MVLVDILSISAFDVVVMSLPAHTFRISWDCDFRASLAAAGLHILFASSSHLQRCNNLCHLLNVGFLVRTAQARPDFSFNEPK